MLYSLIISCLVLLQLLAGYCVVSIAELIACNLSRLVLGAKQTNFYLSRHVKNSRLVLASIYSVHYREPSK